MNNSLDKFDIDALTALRAEGSMTAIVTALRALAEAAIANSSPHEEDWYESDHLMRVVAETDALFIAAMSPDVALRLIDRIGSLERLLHSAHQAQRAAETELAQQMARAAMQREIDSLRVLSLDMAALLREARDAITLAGYGSRMAPEVRDTLERIDAAISKKDPQ